MKNTIGIVFGTFAPMHKGHIDLIQRAKRENDSVLVIVSGYEGDRGDKIDLDLQRRFRYIRETFHDDALVDVMKLVVTTLKIIRKLSKLLIVFTRIFKKVS